MLRILLVTSPGVQLEAYEPLYVALRDRGAEVTPVAFPCSGDLDRARDLVARTAAELGPDVVVVAHGLGATVALLAHGDAPPSRYVLLAPILDLKPTLALEWVAGRSVGTALDLSVATDAPAQVLLGPGAERYLGCVAPRVATTVQHWIREGAVPLDLEAVDRPVWIGVGLLDEVATVEAVVPASRRLPRRELVRLGINRLDPRDYTHLDLLLDPVPIEAAVQAVFAPEGP